LQRNRRQAKPHLRQEQDGFAADGVGQVPQRWKKR
jgi:hypothetical protein